MRFAGFVVALASLTGGIGISAAQVVPTDDSFTTSAKPAANFGNSNALTVGSGSTSFLRFSFDELPTGLTGANVSGASVVLYVDAVLTTGTIDVYQLAGPWSEKTITDNNAPPWEPRF